MPKAYTKSFNGCGQCKRRRVRCDLKPPVCSNCKRRAEQCDYTHQEPLTVPRGQQANVNQSQKWNVIEWKVPQQSSLQPQQRELLHQFATNTSITASLLDDAVMHRIWQEKVPFEAQAHPFLLHEISALAALHLSHLQGSAGGKHRVIACRHHAMALKNFRANVSRIDKDNSAATVAFSLLAAIYQFAMSSMYYSLDWVEQLNGLLGALSALRSSWYLTTNNRLLIEQGPLGILLTRPRHLVETSLDSETSSVLNNLELINQLGHDPEEEKVVYSATIKELHRWYSFVSLFPCTWAHIIRWPATLSPGYLTLLERKQSMALVILAHWCVPVHNAPYRWFMEGWAKRAVYVLSRLVDDRFVPVMQWPLNKVGWSTELDPKKQVM